MGYRIKTVAEMVGVPRNTLLAWERRYDLISPNRRPNNYREYSLEDVRRLRELKALIDAGHRVGEAVTLLRDRDEQRPEPGAGVLPGGSLDGLNAIIREALVDYDRGRADRLARALESWPYRDRIDQVYFPLLRDMGELWASCEISVAQEHFASAWCRERMMAMLMALGSGPPGGPVALCACYPEERHELGLLGVAIHLALEGWRIAWLGADMPVAALCDLLQEDPPAMVCASSILVRPGSELADYARQLRKAAPPDTRVVVGGAGIVPAELPVLDGVEWVREIGSFSFSPLRSSPD